MFKIIRYSILAITFVYIFLSLIIGFEASMVPTSIIVILSVNIYMLFLSRHNFLFLFVAFVIFYSNYSIVYVNYINYIEGTFTQIISDWVSIVSLNVLVFFNCVLLLVFRWDKIQPSSSHNIFVDKKRSNNLIVLLLSIALLIIFKYGYTVPELGSRGQTSAAYEYSIILFILLFYYSGNSRKTVYWGVFLVILYSLQGFLYGGRIEGIQLLLCAYFMLFMNKIKKYKVILLSLIMFLIMSIVGSVRGELMSGNFDVESILKKIVERGFTLDTSYAAYYSSESFIFVKQQLSEDTIRGFFYSFLESLAIGGGSGTDASLPAISSKYVTHYGGGILPFYFYFYLGVIGIIISSLIVSAYLNSFLKVKENSSGLLKCVFILIVCTVFRWYLYSPLMLLRGTLFMVIAYYGLFIFHNLTKPYLRKSIRTQV